MTDSETLARTEERLASIREAIDGLRAGVERSFLGHRDVVDLLILCVLADGHCLLEGAPGLGKTTLVKGLAASLDLSFQRIQFTPDLMPADILGTRILDEDSRGGHTFRFEKGPVFTNVLLADEVNRATPRTQSALLEAMQERQVTVHGERLALAAPFFVIATQNPIEMEGTYPLPEAQLDRFVCKVELSAPGEAELITILEATTGGARASRESVLTGATVQEMQALTRDVQVSSDVLGLVARVVRATDPSNPSAPEEVHRHLRYGSSPRGGQALLLLGKARALLRGHPWVAKEDLEAVLCPALRHRLVFSYEGEASGIHPDEIVRQAWAAASRRE